MTTETKLGLLLGMGVIILVGIFISDHLSKANSQQPPGLAESIPPLDESDLPPSIEDTSRDGGGLAADDSGNGAPLPLPEDFEAERTGSSSRDSQPSRSTQPASDRPGASDPADRQQASAEDAGPEPRVFDVDLRPALISNDDGQNEEVIDGEAPISESSREVASANPRDLPEGFEYVGEEPETRRFEPDDSSASSNGRDDRSRQVGASSSSSRESRTRQSRDDSGSSNEPVVHHVKENETLWSIARDYYDNPGYHKVIYEANKDAISNPDALRAGVRLVIPDEAGSVSRRQGERASAESEASSSGGATQSYTIGKNDTIWSIANRFYGSGAKWQDLYEMNKDVIDDPDRLTVGDEIRVPVR